MGVVVVGVVSQRLLEGPHRRLGVAGEQERPAVVRPQRGQLGVQLQGPPELLEGLGHVAGGKRHRAEHVVGLRRVPALQEPVHEGLALLDLAVAGQRHAEQVEDRTVVGVRRGHRPQQRFHRVELAESEPAVRQEKGDPQVLGRRRAERLQLLRSPGQGARLVVGQGQVVADAGVGHRGQGLLVLLDGLLVPTQSGQGGPEVRPRRRVAPLHREGLPVGRHRRLEVPRLMQGHRALVGRAGVVRGRCRCGNEPEESGQEQGGRHADVRPKRHVSRV